MLPWIHLATATATDGDRLRLLRRGDEFSIRLGGGNELMNSRLGHSEEALARLALTRLSGRPAPQVLIGGLGMGFTLRAAQAAAPPDARLVVAEIVPELVGWAGQHMASVFGDCLADPRVRVETRDVGAMIREATGQFDAILLDVDNGPDGLTRPGNQALYHENGLGAARRALAPSTCGAGRGSPTTTSGAAARRRRAAARSRPGRRWVTSSTKSAGRSSAIARLSNSAARPVWPRSPRRSAASPGGHRRCGVARCRSASGSRPARAEGRDRGPAYAAP